MQEHYGPRKLSARARDLPQSLNQLTSDANSLHDVVLDLIDSYNGEDKNVKLTKVRCAYQSLIANIEFLNKNMLYAQYDTDSKHSEDSKIRRGSFFERIMSWKSHRDDHPLTPDGHGGVTRRSNKKSTRSRANTNSPLKMSPRSSTESLNNKCRLSTCSYSLESEIDYQVDPKLSRAMPHITSGSRSYSKGSSARSHPNRTSTFQELFRKTATVDEFRPVITGPVLQHTSNKSISNPTTVDNG